MHGFRAIFLGVALTIAVKAAAFDSDQPVCRCPYFSASQGTSDQNPSQNTCGDLPCPNPKSVAEWQDLKFGFMGQWGISTILGVEASWGLNWDTVYMYDKDIKTREAMIAYRKKYWDGIKKFNPTTFVAQKFMGQLRKAGFKYFVGITKHHDGFAMFNTSSEASPGMPVYGTTGPESPLKRDLIGELSLAARKEGLKLGLYYSKADWYSDYYWDKTLTNKSSNGFPEHTGPSYEIANFPDQWQKFVHFNNAQLMEIVTQYSPDVLWLDAPWLIGPHWIGGYNHTHDVALALEQEIPKWKRHKESMLVVNRQKDWVNGPGQDYLTPEGTVPSTYLPVPWETCMTMGTRWSYIPNDTYKDSDVLIRTLMDIIAKGGNLLLNIGPQSDGFLPPPAERRIKEMGSWLEYHGDACVYGSRPIWPHVFNITYNEHGSAAQLRLTRKGLTICIAIWDVPRYLVKTMNIPFVVNVPGGLDGSWPQGPLREARVQKYGMSDQLPIQFNSRKGFVFDIPLSCREKSYVPCMLMLSYEY